MLICWMVMAAVPASARDFIVEFVDEHYKETQQPYSHTPMIYHSIQVTSDAGPKLLILTGSDFEYRSLLRQYIAQDKSFMVQVPEDENDLFISSKAFEIDVNNVHPFSGEKWAPGELGKKKKAAGTARSARMLHGDSHIMVLDTNTKRSRLITSVINRMGYTAMVSRDGQQALHTFKNQPEKFKMIITNHQVPGMPAEQFITDLLKIDHQIPILLETGYNQPKTKEKFISKFSGAGTVTVTPVVLDDLQNTIKEMVKQPSAGTMQKGGGGAPPMNNGRRVNG